MSEATAAQPAPDPPQTLEELAATGNAAVERTLARIEAVERLLRAAMAGEGLDRFATELVMTGRRIADDQADLRRYADRLDAAADLRTALEIREAARAALAPVPEPEPARPRSHRKPRRDSGRQSPLLRGLPALVPAGVAALRHSWATHPVVTAATASTAAVAIAATAAVAPHASSVLPFGAGTSQVPAPAASIWSAAPMPLPSSSLRLAGAVTKPRAGGDAASSAPLVASTAWTEPAYAPPGGAQDPAPNPDPGSPDQGAVTGTLQVSATGLDLGVAYAGSVTVTAVGGPVSWGAVPGSSGITLGATRGTLQAGESATIGVTVSAAAQVLGGSATVRIWPGDITVTVTWAALPVPVPSPSDLPVSLPPVAGT